MIHIKLQRSIVTAQAIIQITVGNITEHPFTTSALPNGSAAAPGKLIKEFNKKLK